MIKPFGKENPFFISLRWRVVFPLAVAVMVVAMIGAYAVASVLSEGYGVSEESILLQSAEGVLNETVRLYETQANEALRISYTQGIAEALQAGQADALFDSLKSLAQVADLDTVVAINRSGVEVAGVVRVTLPQGGQEYSVSTNTNAGDIVPIRAILDGKTIGTGLLLTTENLMLVTAVPVVLNEQTVGVLMVGQVLSEALTRLKISAIADIAFYAPNGTLASTTLDLNTERLAGLVLPANALSQALTEGVPIRTALTIDNALYRVIVAPFVFGDATLGAVATLTPNNIPFVTQIGRQMTALLSATLAGVAVMVAFGVVHRASARLEQVAETAQALASGNPQARTRMKANDEVGAIGQALDQFADESQAQQDRFRTLLRRERRERTYLFSVLESLPSGVIVQDMAGQVLVMNDHARQLLGAQATFSSAMQGFQHVVNEMLGASLAPGIYALGKPQQIERNGTMLSAQAAAVLSPSHERLGTVILLSDISQQVRQEQAREQLLSQLSEDIQQPLQEIAQTGANAPQPMMNDFAREISRHAASLQKMIVDMRELTQYNRAQARQVQRALSVETLLWAVANDWRQIAQAASLTLSVQIDKTGLFVLGDESRLRLALGNVVDNATKYTPSGGTISLEIKDAIDGAVHLRVRDNGVGISNEDMVYLFTSFYRGTPTHADGQMIRVPGMGQGLPIAKGIIEAHGGLIKVKSRVGIGTAVYFALPLTSGISYSLPMMNNADLEGDTVAIPPNTDLEAYWRRS